MGRLEFEMLILEKQEEVGSPSRLGDKVKIKRGRIKRRKMSKMENRAGRFPEQGRPWSCHI